MLLYMREKSSITCDQMKVQDYY